LTGKLIGQAHQPPKRPAWIARELSFWIGSTWVAPWLTISSLLSWTDTTSVYAWSISLL